MRKEMKGFFTGAITTSLIFLIAFPAFAEPIGKTISVFFNNIKIYVNGDLIQPKDANGNKVEPFIYNGTTYLPVRAVSQALGKVITWDDNTNSIYISEFQKTSEPQSIVTGPLRNLTEEEVAYFEDKLLKDSGFLTCEYSEPSKIDPNEGFYCGCGLNMNISEEEKEDLLKNHDFSENDFSLDYIKIKPQDINNLLLKKIGLTLEGIEKKLNYKYVSEYDAYYKFHGDTNYVDLKCFNGYATNYGVYEIDYVAHVHSSNPENYKVIFKIVDDSVVFISNTKLNK